MDAWAILDASMSTAEDSWFLTVPGHNYHPHTVALHEQRGKTLKLASI